MAVHTTLRIHHRDGTHGLEHDGGPHRHRPHPDVEPTCHVCGHPVGHPGHHLHSTGQTEHLGNGVVHGSNHRVHVHDVGQHRHVHRRVGPHTGHRIQTELERLGVVHSSAPANQTTGHVAAGAGHHRCRLQRLAAVLGHPVQLGQRPTAVDAVGSRPSTIRVHQRRHHRCAVVIEHAHRPRGARHRHGHHTRAHRPQPGDGVHDSRPPHFRVLLVHFARRRGLSWPHRRSPGHNLAGGGGGHHPHPLGAHINADEQRTGH